MMWDALLPTLNMPSEKVRLLTDFRRMVGNALFGIHKPHDIILVRGKEIGRLIYECLTLIGHKKAMIIQEDIFRDGGTFHHACIEDEILTLLLLQPYQNLKDSSWTTMIAEIYGSDSYRADDLGPVGVQVHPVICIFTDKVNDWSTPIEYMNSLLDLNLTAKPPSKVNYDLAQKKILSAEEVTLLKEWFSDGVIDIPVPIPNAIAHYYKQ